MKAGQEWHELPAALRDAVSDAWRCSALIRQQQRLQKHEVRTGDAEGDDLEEELRQQLGHDGSAAKLPRPLADIVLGQWPGGRGSWASKWADDAMVTLFRTS